MSYIRNKNSMVDYDDYLQKLTGNRWRIFEEEYLHLYDIPKEERKHIVVDKVKYEYELHKDNYKHNEKAMDCYIWVRSKIAKHDFEVIEWPLDESIPKEECLQILIDKPEYYNYLPSAMDADGSASCPGIIQTRSADGTYHYVIFEDFPLFSSKDRENEYGFLNLMGKTDAAYFAAKEAYMNSRK